MNVAKLLNVKEVSKKEVRNVLLRKIEEEIAISEQLDLFSFEEFESPLQYETGRAQLVSLFCGAGGFDLGVELAGLEAVMGRDLTERFLKDKQWFNDNREESIFQTVYAIDHFAEAIETYQKNFPSSVTVEKLDIRKKGSFPMSRIMLGGFPCPGFSGAGKRMVDDERNFLYIQFVRALTETQPDVFVAENVPGMLTLGKGEAFKQIVEDFANAGYRMYHKVLNAMDFGVPQDRKRVFLVGVRHDIDWEYKFPEPTHGKGKGLIPHVTLRDAIYDLKDNPGEYHEGSYSSQFMSRNRKKTWDDQAFTIQASGRHANLHPDGEPMLRITSEHFEFRNGEENERRLSVRESARIQTFPDWMEFSMGNPKAGHNTRVDKAYTQIGNAVPVLLARAVAKPIAEWMVERRHML